MATNMKSDGGPAFPRPYSSVDYNLNSSPREDQEGMSLRDWFAGQALRGFVSRGTSEPKEVIAKWCYGMADAMLAERQKE